MRIHRKYLRISVDLYPFQAYSKDQIYFLHHYKIEKLTNPFRKGALIVWILIAKHLKVLYNNFYISS